METQYLDWTNQLKKMLRLPKPAAKAHILAAPDDRIEGLVDRIWPADAKQSAVTFLIFPDKGRLSTLLMTRVVYNGVHSGQISLPGGQRDTNDANLLATAIREFDEETGIQLQTSDYLGELSDIYIPPSHFLVQPFVAFVAELPALRPDVREVQELHIISLEELFHPDNFKQEEVLVRQRQNHQYTIKAPCYQIKELCIWGATAMMISELHSIFMENSFNLPQ